MTPAARADHYHVAVLLPAGTDAFPDTRQPPNKEKHMYTGQTSTTIAPQVRPLYDPVDVGETVLLEELTSVQARSDSSELRGKVVISTERAS